jgi:glucose/mannose-6-phosphate isomerase
MNLDDLSHLEKTDAGNMRTEIADLPDQLARAWELGKSLPLPGGRSSDVLKPAEISNIVISGMGGSAIGGDLLAAYVANMCPVPIIVHRDYGLPSFAAHRETLFIASSHSGETEETLDSFKTALEAGCTCLAICTGGKLAEEAAAAGLPVWHFEHHGQPRAAVGYSFGLLLALLAGLGLIPPQDDLVAGAVAAMKRSQQHLAPEVPTTGNPAKRYAGQLMGRLVTVIASGYLAPVARRWKTQINEVAKAAATFESLPEADHNTLQGLIFPENTLNAHTMTLFLRSPSDHPRDRLRSDLTRQGFMLEGLNTDFTDARGETPLDHIWTQILFGDYMAFYLAIAYGVDPTPVPTLQTLKETLRSTPI